jgi:ParB-like chromosome segregation protein Spo0J
MKKQIYAAIQIEDVVFDEKLYPRNNYFWQTAYDYSESMKTGVKFPRIVVAKIGNAFVLVDCKHRLEASKILKQKVIEAEVLVGLTKEQIFEEAIRRNIAHGKPLSVQEKLNVAVKLKDMSYTTELISKLIQIPTGKLKDLLGRRLYSSITGEEIILKKPFENMSKSPNENTFDTVELAQKEFQGQDQGNIIDELVILLETKALDIRANLVKLTKLKKLINGIKQIK